MNSIDQIVKSRLCLGCGICTYDKSIRSLEYCPKSGIYIPVLESGKRTDLASAVCPAKGYDIYADGKAFYGEGDYSIELGFVDKLFAAHSSSQRVLKNASSGGVMTEVLIYMLEKNIVDKVAVTKFVYTRSGPKTTTYLTDDIEELYESQGSKYCPVDISNCIQEIKNYNYRIAFVGTPCQIAGIRQIQKFDKGFRKKIIVTIANFCGGFKNYNEIKKISRRHGIDYTKISFLRYRGGGQPGSMVISDTKGNRFESSYRLYGGFTGYSKMLRCHLCVDATGELADIACGDAWLDKYLQHSYPWSIILTRNKYCSSIIESMVGNKKIVVEPITKEEVCNSQSQNITSKKIRHLSRSKVYRFLGYTLPIFDGGYYTTPTSLRTELKVYLFHRLKLIIEEVGLYKYLRIFIGKEY